MPACYGSGVPRRSARSRAFRLLAVVWLASVLLLSAAGSGQANTVEAPTILATEGQSFSGLITEIKAVCEFGALSEQQTTINWGDSHSSSGTTAAGEQADGVSISGSHTYSTTGSYVGEIVGSYRCNQVTFHYTAAFKANVAVAPAPPQEPVPTVPSVPTAPPVPPSPSPVVHATFALSSLTPGRAVLDASASVPAGAQATRYSWSVTGGASPDVVCQGSQPLLALDTRSPLHATVTLTATDAQGVGTIASQTLDIPAPAALAKEHLVHSASAASLPRLRTAHDIAVTPSFPVLGECAGVAPVSLPPLRDASLVGNHHLAIPLGHAGEPPAECNQDVEFGAADVRGCLAQIGDPHELPGGITLLLASLLCGVHDHSFCSPPLTAAASAAVGLIASRDEPGALTASAEKAAGLVTASLGRLGFPSYYSWSAIRIDGLDIEPQNGQPILVIPSASIVVSADASIYLHGIRLSPLRTIALYLPAVGGQLGEISLPHKVPIIGSLPFNGSIGLSFERAGKQLPNGDVCAFDCAAVSVSAELPGVFSSEGHGLSAGAVITADDQQGLQLDSLELSIPHAEIAGIGVENVDFRYRHSDDSLSGQATIEISSAGSVSASFAIVHGAFQAGHVSWEAGDGPGIDLGGPFPIFLTKLGGGISLNPTVLSAEGAIAAGGHALGCALFGVYGEINVQFSPFDLNATAQGEMLCQHVAEEYFHVDEAGDIGVGGSVELSIYILSFKAGVALEISQGHFQFDGNVNACLHILGEHCLGAEVVISDHGVGACADLGFTHAGGGIVFPADYKFMLDSCDIAQFRSLPMPANLASASSSRLVLRDGLIGPAIAAQALPGFRVPRGEKVAAVGVEGTGGAPNVTLVGPDGRKIATPPDGYLKDPNEFVLADPTKTKETYFLINHPAPGNWRIESDPSSVPVSGVQQSAGLPSPNLHAHLTHMAGGRERLRYSLRSIHGQKVTFVDGLKGHGFRVLGNAHGTHGTLRFTPDSALGRRHEVVAWVTRDGSPREDVALAHYRAPAQAPLRAPRRLRIVRHGATVVVSWQALGTVKSYALEARLSNGVRRYYSISAQGHGSRRTATLSAPTYLGVRVSVAGVSRGAHGRAGKRSVKKLARGPRPRGVSIKPLLGR